MKIKQIVLLALSALILTSCELVEDIRDFLAKKEAEPVKEYIFPGVHGPTEATPLPKPQKTTPEQFAEGGRNCLAIYLTEIDADWLGLVRGLKSIGIPFIITQDYKKALTHKVVFAYPYLSYPVVSDKDKVGAIKEFLNKGHILLTGNDYGSLNHIFGIHEKDVSKSRDLVVLSDHAWTKMFTHPAERTIRIAQHDMKEGALSTTGFLEGHTAATLAAYEDGTPSIVAKHYGEGEVIVFGFDLGMLLNKSFNNEQPVTNDYYANRFIPGVDVFLRFIKGLYTEYEPNSVILYTVPYNKALSVIYTHDVDYNLSVPNSLEFAKYEQSQGIGSTYFILTHYIRDYNDLAYFDDKAIVTLNKLHNLGRELGSEAVSHSNLFSKFPLGTGTETYPEYMPVVLSYTKEENGSIMGEVRVSKFLLESLINNLKIVSFRPGYLSEPKALPQCIRATGYKYTSSETANNAWSHLPFQLTFDRGSEALEDIFQFPITIEDEQLPQMDTRIGLALDVAKNISRYGGLCVVLSHPNIAGFKLRFEELFIPVVKEYSWIGSISNFGDFWSARHKIIVAVKEKDKMKTVSLKVPEPISGLTLHIPKGWTFKSASSNAENVTQQDQAVLMDHASGNIELTFEVTKT